MRIEAVNNFVFLLRDKTETEKGGFLIPGKGQEKQHIGKIVSVGDTVQSGKIKKSVNKKGMFHAGSGFEIEIEDEIYLVLEGNQIIGVEK